MTANSIVLSVAQYRVTDEKSGVENKGCTVRHLMTDNLSPYEETVRKVKGRVPAKSNVPYEDFNKFPSIPGIYEVEFDYAIDSKGVASIKASGFKFLSTISINQSGFGSIGSGNVNTGFSSPGFSSTNSGVTGFGSAGFEPNKETKN